jgi:hypothetical protein
MAAIRSATSSTTDGDLIALHPRRLHRVLVRVDCGLPRLGARRRALAHSAPLGGSEIAHLPSSTTSTSTSTAPTTPISFVKLSFFSINSRFLFLLSRLPTLRGFALHLCIYPYSGGFDKGLWQSTTNNWNFEGKPKCKHFDSSSGATGRSVNRQHSSHIIFECACCCPSNHFFGPTAPPYY